MGVPAPCAWQQTLPPADGSLAVGEEERSASELSQEWGQHIRPSAALLPPGADRGTYIGTIESFWVSPRPVRGSRFGCSTPRAAGSLDLDEEKQSALDFFVQVGTKNVPLQRHCSQAGRQRGSIGTIESAPCAWLRPLRGCGFGRSTPGPAGSLDLDEEDPENVSRYSLLN